VGRARATVGVIANPLAGKDVRRFLAPVSHTSDAAKVGIVRRVVSAAVEAGATRVLLADDPHHLAARAAERLHLPAGVAVNILDEPLTGSRLDTVHAATRMWKEQCGAVVALGGDGTCRDVAIGWPDVPLVAISTGTNNVFPLPLDGTSAGAAAGLVACGAVPVESVTRRAKRVAVHVDGSEGDPHDLALVDVALVAGDFAGARAVVDGASVRWVVAAIAQPASTGLSAVAGRTHPVGRAEPGGVLVRLGRAEGARRVRVPLAPGAFTTLEVAEVRPLADGEPVVLPGGGVLAFDGERDRRVPAGTTITVAVEATGPLLVDVDQTLVQAARERRFDLPEVPHGG
jgi:predicted polyphosphate/ATP-dependent NAD kinase